MANTEILKQRLEECWQAFCQCQNEESADYWYRAWVRTNDELLAAEKGEEQ